jgi:hypothetical protein
MYSLMSVLMKSFGFDMAAQHITVSIVPYIASVLLTTFSISLGDISEMSALIETISGLLELFTYNNTIGSK